ncbi:8-oxo-dGTP diphosphatase [Clostridium sp. UBA6640]|uniref:8-oxo-dGTP diphosphatase n=1 Tax=Clostridium sp. UBA6640 TaxID=1946370 RepID=UPI0025C45D02|nr:8-oxo-dGTP diphosphatase [Clostridium sp. UBA6640]
MENIELTNMTMVIDKENNKVLVQNRIKGNWTGIAFPGGHIEKGESIVDSAIREIKEETGLIINDLEICGIKDWYISKDNKRYIVFLFKTYSYKGKLIEHGEEGDVFWQNIDELHLADFAHGFDNMIKVMLDIRLNEYFIAENKDKSDWNHIVK